MEIKKQKNVIKPSYSKMRPSKLDMFSALLVDMPIGSVDVSINGGMVIDGGMVNGRSVIFNRGKKKFVKCW